MPPSDIFQLFKKTECRRLRIRTPLNISRATYAKLKEKGKSRSKDLWFLTTYAGEGKLRIAHSVVIAPIEKKGTYALNMYWFPVAQDPPTGFLPIVRFEQTLQESFGEREVDVQAEFLFDKGQIVSLFKPIDIGEQSQILDEIVGFKGVKRDREGKLLYTMGIDITDNSIEQIVSFRQTVRLEVNMPIALLETAGKLSALAIKPKEAA